MELGKPVGGGLMNVPSIQLTLLPQQQKGRFSPCPAKKKTKKNHPANEKLPQPQALAFLQFTFFQTADLNFLLSSIQEWLRSFSL